MAKLKAAKTEFLEENLPQTRKEQFFDLLKNQYKIVFFIGLTLLLFFIPLITKSVLVDFFYEKEVLLKNSGVITEAQAQSSNFMIWLISSASNVLLYPILFLGLSGIMRVLKQFIFGEVVTFIYDFKLGVKDNYKHFLILGLFTGLLRFLFDFIVISFANVSAIKIGAYVLFLLFFLPPVIVCFVYSSIYKNKLFTSFKHSYLIYLRGSWKILLPIAIGIGSYIALDVYLNIPGLKQIIFALLILFVLPLLLLAGFMVIYSVFDLSINIYHYPEIVRKGLYVSETEKEQIKKIVEDLKDGQN